MFEKPRNILSKSITKVEKAITCDDSLLLKTGMETKLSKLNYISTNIFLKQSKQCIIDTN
jgi:hypothetical protein